MDWQTIRSQWADWIVNRPWSTTGLALLIFLPLTLGLLNLKITVSPREVLGTEHEVMQNLAALEEKYIEDNNFIVMLQPDQGDIFNPEFLAAVKFFTDEAWYLPNIRRVDSLSNFQYTDAKDDDLIVTDLVEEPIALSAADLQRIKSLALNDPRLSRALVAADGQATGINMIFDVDVSDPVQIRSIQSALTDIRETVESTYPGIKTYESGMLSVTSAWDRLANRDMRLIYPLAALLVFFGLLFFYRNLGATLATILVALLSAMAGVGSVGIMGGFITPQTILGGLMIAMLALADSVHIVNAIQRFLSQGMQRKAAIAASLRANFTAVALTSVTTAVGFFSFSFSENLSNAYMGRFVGVGVLVAFLLSITLLPVLLYFCNLKPSAKSGRDQTYRQSAALVIRYYWLLLLITVPVMLASLFIAPQNRIDDGMSLFIHPGDDYRRDTDKIEAELTGIGSLIYDLDSGQANGVNEPAFIQQVETFTQWLRAQDEIHQVSSYTDTLKQLNYNLHNNDTSWYKLPDSAELSAQYLLLYELSLPYGLDLTTQLDINKSSARVVAITDDLGTVDTRLLVERVDKQLATIAPKLATTASGVTASNNFVIDTSLRSTLQSAVSAVAIIGVILLIAFRAIVPGLLGTIMVVAPLIVTFSWWALSVGYVGTPATTAICMVIGIIVDNAVHFLTKYLRARQRDGLTPAEAISEAFVNVGSALVVNASVLAGGFGLFLFSAFQFNTVMGQLTLVSVILSLIATLTLLPSLLLLTEKLGRKKAPCVSQN